MTRKWVSGSEATFLLANVPDHLLPLAFGTKACSAGDVPKVPKAWELGASACSAYFLFRKRARARAGFLAAWMTRVTIHTLE